MCPAVPSLNINHESDENDRLYRAVCITNWFQNKNQAMNYIVAMPKRQSGYCIFSYLKVWPQQLANCLNRCYLECVRQCQAWISPAICSFLPQGPSVWYETGQTTEEANRRLAKLLLSFMSSAKPEYITLCSLCWKGQALDCIWLVPACKRPRTKEIYIIAEPSRP